MVCKLYKLSWYVTWKEISKQQQDTPTQSSSTLDFHQNLFISQWQTNLSKQNNMAFYRQIKHSFGEEAYLGLRNRYHRSHIAKIRSSSHDLKIEKGRYTYSGNYADPACKLCRFCCNNSDGTMTIFLNLPFCEDLIFETEEHALTECPIRKSQKPPHAEGVRPHHVNTPYEFGRYLSDCHRLRNPKAKDSTTSD